MLDADEELIDGARLKDLLHDEEVEGYCLREVNFIGEELGVESVVNSAFRLFRNRPAYRYDGALHEQIMGKVDPVGGVCTRFVGIEIHHYGYLEPTSRAKEKTDRNMAIVMEEVARKPTDSFTLFNAGVEFQRIGDHETALGYFRRSFNELASLKAYYASLLLRNIVASLHSLERWDEALDVLSDALQAYPDFTDLHYLQGQIHTGRREYRAAVKSFRRAIELGDHDGARYLAQAGMGSFYSWHALGQLYEMMGDTHEAVRCQRNAIRDANGFYAAPVMHLTRLLLRSDPPLEVREYLGRIIGTSRRAESLRALAQVLLAEGHPEHALAVLTEARELGPDDSADQPDDVRRADPARRPRRRPRADRERRPGQRDPLDGARQAGADRDHRRRRRRVACGDRAAAAGGRRPLRGRLRGRRRDAAARRARWPPSRTTSTARRCSRRSSSWPAPCWSSAS